MTVKVMVVEDERIVAFNLKQRLLKLGYAVPSVVATGEKALASVASDTPDIVLMDINIEGELDGIQTVERLGGDPRLPVIYLTAHSEEATLARARETQPYGYLIKPFSERELHATIQMALQRWQTERALREAKREIESINTTLETRIKERTQQLLDAKREAEAANRAKTLFLANMSHEIRTPLNAVLGLCYLLQKTELSDLQRDYVEKADSAAKFLLGILNDILDFSKVEAGKLDLEQTEFDLSDMINNVAALISTQAEESGLSLTVETPGVDGLEVLGDPMRLQQVLVNLGSNAVKFTEAGTVTISVQVVEQSVDDVRLQFSVSDTGPGLSREQIERLFEAFQQADTSTTRRYGGTGLGLVICKRLVQLMGSDIAVDSIEGEGSNFYFEIRLPLVTIKKPRTDTETSVQLRNRLKNARLLLVEDNTLNQQVASAILRHEGIDVDIAENGAVAVELIRRLGGDYYDAILMDLQMPEMDGFQATELIRGLPGTRHLPILAMSADIIKEDRALCIEKGMNDFVAKPLRVNEFFHTLAYWLKRGSEETL